MINISNLIFWLLLHNSTASILIEDTNFHASFTQCIYTIVHRYFEEKRIISIVIPNVLNTSEHVGTVSNILLFKKIHQNLRWSVFTRRITEAPYIEAVRTKPHNYIIEIIEEHDMIRTIQFLNKTWNPHAKFVITVTKKFRNPKSILRKLTKTLWKYKAVDFIYMVPKFENADLFEIYTWYPYENNNCGENYNQIKIINLCENGVLSERTELFTRKVPRNLHGCPVRVRTVIWPPYVVSPDFLNRSQIGINFTEGLEISLLNTVAKKANFNVIYTVSSQIQDWGTINMAGTSTGLFNAVMTAEVDLAIGALAASPPRFIHLDPSLSYTTESLTWCLPRALLKPKWMNIFQVLSLHTWISITVAFVTVSLSIWMLGYWHTNEFLAYKTASNCFLNMLAVLISLSTNIKPRCTTVRLIFFLWSTASLTLTAIYQTSLINFLLRSHYDKQINTVEKILETNLSFGYLHISRFYFGVDDTWIQKTLRRQGIICFDVEKCLYDISHRRNYSMVIPRLYLLSTEMNYRKSNGEHLLYWFKEDYISYPVQILAHRGFPLLNRIDVIISRIVQTGLLSKWESDMKQLMHKQKHQVQVRAEQIPDILSMKHLQGAFNIYLFGMVTSIVIFVLELIIFKYAR